MCAPKPDLQWWVLTFNPLAFYWTPIVSAALGKTWTCSTIGHTCAFLGTCDDHNVLIGQRGSNHPASAVVRRSSTAETMIRAENLGFAYRAQRKSDPNNHTHNIGGINFVLSKGSSIGVVGGMEPKSTLLRVLAGIFAPTSGQLSIAPGATIGLLALGVGFNGFLTGRDNAVLSALLMGYSSKTAENHLEDIKKFSELGDAFERPVRTYSSGMRARLSFSTLLHLHVDVLLIDEVLAVGDGHFARKAKAALREKVEGDQTVVLVSHSAKDITELCDTAIWLSGNAMKLAGPAHEVVQAYEASL